MIKVKPSVQLALVGLAFILAVASCSATRTHTTDPVPWPVTSLHYASNGNLSQKPIGQPAGRSARACVARGLRRRDRRLPLLRGLLRRRPQAVRLLRHG